MRSNNIFKGKKELIHAIRYLMFASQITTHGSIIDYTCANDLWQEILQDSSTDWEGYITKYERLVNEHKEKFKATCAMHKFYGKMEVCDSVTCCIHGVRLYATDCGFYAKTF